MTTTRAPAEASANLARYDGVRYGLRVDGADPAEMYQRTRGAGFGSEVKRRILLGTYVLSSGYYDAYYLRAQKVRTLIRRDFLSAFEQVDAILTPTTPGPPFKLGEKVSDPLQMYLEDIFTLSCNLAGLCGLSVPCGFTREPRLPIGLQLLGRPFGEAGLLRLGSLLAGRSPVLVVLEATGGYEVGLVADLASAGMPVAVVNPRQIRDFARAIAGLER